MAISGVLRQYDFKQYSGWVEEHDKLREEARENIRDSIGQLPHFPMFSFVLLPTSGGATLASRATIDSVFGQLYPRWELWLPSQINPSVGDPRLRPIPNDGTSEPTLASLFNTALAAAEGEFVLPLPVDTTISDSALYELVLALGHNPTVDLLYTDEDRVTAEGKRCKPHFKTAWDPDLILGRDAIGLLVAYRKSLLDRLGGTHLFFCNVSLFLYDLALRVSSATSAGRIQHIAAVLCHRLDYTEASLRWDAEGAREIVRQHLTDGDIRARVEPAPFAPSWNRIVRDVPDPTPLVSVIIPVRDNADLLERCTDALLRRTDYPELELLVVDNDSRETTTAELLLRLSEHPKIQVLSYPGGFNYSAMNNLAARYARGEILLLLNNDVDSIHPHWLTEMVSNACRPDIGAVGARLLYPNGQVQHAGIVLGPGLTINHQFRFADRWDAGACGELALTRTVSAVTGACLALRRSVFFEVGGLDNNLSVAYNDIDLCMRIGDYGYRIIWTPFAELFHLESASRGYDTTPEKLAVAVEESRVLLPLLGGSASGRPLPKSKRDLRMGHYNSFPAAVHKRPPLA